MAANLEKKDKKNTTPIKKVAALRYNNLVDAAPKVVAKGQQEIAKKIIEIAEEHGIPLHKDADLINVLDAVEINQEIPLEVYTIVAEIFAYLYRVNKTKENS